jgi:hypothetical protein
MDNKASTHRWPMDSADTASVIIGLGFLVLVGVIFIVTLRTMSTLDGFLTVWTAVGPIVGVVIGSMPAHFFRSAAKAANDQADAANVRADAANARADEMVGKVADMGEKMAQMRA